MVKLIAIYQMASDVPAFEKHYRDIHCPLAMKLPGLKKCELGWVRGALGGNARYHLVAELYFEDHAALNRAINSPEGEAAAKDVGSFAGPLVHLMIANVEEMTP